MKKYLLILGVFALVAVFSSCSKTPDIVYFNGKIHTMDKNNSVIEAVALKDGKIMDTGTNQEINDKYESAEKIDLEGKTVIPGLIDAEGSLVNYALNLSNIYLEKFESRTVLENKINEMKNRFSAGTWIKVFYYGKDEATDDSITNLDRKYLDNIATDYNLYIINNNGTIAICNSKILSTFKITNDTEPPENGDFAYYENGELAGLLFGDAVKLIDEKQRTVSREDMAKYLEVSASEIIKVGITAVRDRTLNKESIGILRNLIDSNRFPLRVNAVISYEDQDLFNEYITKGIEKNYKDRLSVRSVSIDVDGSFEFALAEMSGKYKNANIKSFAFNSENEVEDFISKAFDNEFQVNVKAVGDKAVNITLNVLERNIKLKNPKDHRTIIEHIQFIQPQDILRFKELKTIPSVRPEIQIDDFSILNRLIDDVNAKNLGLWNSLLQNSGMLIVGSDFPFPNRTIIPFVQIYYLVTRMSPYGSDMNIINPDEKLTIDDAVKSYTYWAAYSNFEEETRGTIEKNKFADMVVLSEDIFNSPPEKLLTVRVLKTIIEGNVVFNSTQVN
ncbi:MAG: amidohydrolase [Ignavibacteria bacterium]|nr:amidohydrolase [Ignavibacteria bacterium]